MKADKIDISSSSAGRIIIEDDIKAGKLNVSSSSGASVQDSGEIDVAADISVISSSAANISLKA